MKREELRGFLEHESRKNLVDKGLPWPQSHSQIADWIMEMDLEIKPCD